jgi:type IV pilus assembly protein PilF
MTHRATAAGVAIWAGLLLMLGGCAKPAQTGPAAPPPTEARQPPEPASPERRARVRLELAAAYYANGQYDTALAEVRTAIAAKPDLPEAYGLRGLIQSALGQFGPADESFQRALQLDPRNADTMHNYGWALCQQQRYDEADSQFQRALAQPQYTQATRTLAAQGHCQARAGRLDDAERTLSRAYERDPANPSTAFNLAEVLYRQGDYERARFYVRRINAVPAQSNAQTLWLAARIEHRLGNAAGAQSFGRQVRDRFPNSTEALQFERGRFDD